VHASVPNQETILLIIIIVCIKMAEPACTNLECYLNLPILKISLAVGVLDTLVVIPWSIYLFYKTRFSLDKVSTMQVVALILARIIFIMVWVFYSQFDPNNVDYPLIIVIACIGLVIVLMNLFLFPYIFYTMKRVRIWLECKTPA
jgi:hypothetical protein